MEKNLIEELVKYSEILESYYNDMVDFEFVLENKKIYILSARLGKRTPLANLKIVMSMFCEGRLSVEDVIDKLPYQQLQYILNSTAVINANDLKLIAQGTSASRGASTALACFTYQEAEVLIENEEDFIYCCLEISPDDLSIIKSPYCKGVVAARGGMTSHAAVVCRGLHLPCVTGTGGFFELEETIKCHNNELTIDGENGKVYVGSGIIKSKSIDLQEVNMLRELLHIITKYNIITCEKTFLVWRLWNVVILRKRYILKENEKRIVLKSNNKYISFSQPSEHEIVQINSYLGHISNGELLIEDLIDFLQSQLSANVSLGCHYKYMRPLLDPMDSMTFNEHCEFMHSRFPAGIQLTGLEFFNINKYVDYLIDIYSIKIYFTTAFFCDEFDGVDSREYSPVNYLDYTNPNGEGLIINTYNAKKIAIFINDVFVQLDKLPAIYHLIRRRQYYWSWYKDNNITKNAIVKFLRTHEYNTETIHSKKYYLCEEMNLINNNELTLAGKSLIGDEKMKNNANIDYILDEVVARGYNDVTNVCNDFVDLLKKKDFKELIALELYEVYFWDERHEFDLGLLREIINIVSDYFCDPETLKQIESGILQTVPSAIIISIVHKIWLKLKKSSNKKNTSEKRSSWECIEENIKKIDNEFFNHDYILSNEIERIFGTSREQIQPLLKLCGCKCYIDKNRSIWIKVGTTEARVAEILKEHRFKHKKNH